MKLFIIPSLSFYFYIVICFTGWSINLKACDSIIIHENLTDQNILDAYTTLRVIQRIHKNVQNQFDQLEEQDDQTLKKQDFIIEIMIVLVGMYEKIVAATVTYYLMPMQQDLQNVVAQIIAEETIKILAILGKQFMHFIFNQDMTWQEKVQYCLWIVSIIIMIKLGVDQIPKPVKQEGNDQENYKSSKKIGS